MKNTYWILLLSGLFACNTADKIEEKSAETKSQTELSKEKKTPKLLNEAELIYDNGGKYLERYPTGETKIEGQKNEDGLKEGIWTAYSQDGTKQSVCGFINGKRNGIAMVFHPNGNVSYRGEWKLDERVGEWKFFNQAGTLVKTENYDK